MKNILDQEGIRRDYPAVFEKYEGQGHTVTAVLGVKVDLRKLAYNECVIYGDGKSFHFKITKSDTKN
jgi:hypothetical protein